MKCFSKLLILAAIALLGIGNAQAATVTFDLMIDENGPGTFNLYASTGLDNFGIAAYGAPLTGGILSVNHNSPVAIALDDFQPVGFNLLRSGDGNAGIRASQDTINPTPHLVRGFGQVAGDLLDAPGVSAIGGAEQPIYGAPLLVATGTWAGLLPAFNLGSPDLGANVFTASSGIAVTPAQIVTSTTVVPEPSALILAGAGAVGLIVARRRRATGRRS